MSKQSVLSEISPPEGGRIHIVRVKVKLDREWQEAINLIGPNTPNNYRVRKVGHLYPVQGMNEVEGELLLLNYFQGTGDWDKALRWAQEKQLKNTTPREVFAVGEQQPNLSEVL